MKPSQKPESLTSERGSGMLFAIMAAMFVGVGVMLTTENTAKITKFARAVVSKEKTETSHGSAISVFRNLMRPEHYWQNCRGPTSAGCPYILSENLQ